MTSGKDWPRQLDAGGFHWAGLQNPRQLPAAAGRRKISRAVGYAGAHHGDVRIDGGLDQGRATYFRVPLSVARALSGDLQDYYGPMLKAFEALDETRRQELGNDLLALIGRMNSADDGTMVVPSEYLEVVMVKK